MTVKVKACKALERVGKAVLMNCSELANFQPHQPVCMVTPVHSTTFPSSLLRNFTVTMVLTYSCKTESQSHTLRFCYQTQALSSLNWACLTFSRICKGSSGYTCNRPSSPTTSSTTWANLVVVSSLYQNWLSCQSSFHSISTPS